MPFDLEKLFALSLDLLCIAGLDGYFKRVNPSFTRVLGWPPEELTTRPFLDFVHPEDLDATLREVQKLAAGQPTISFENRYRCADGSYRYLLWTSQPDRAAGLMYAVARDVTERRRMEDELRRSVDEVSDLYNRAPCGYHSLDADGRILRMNDTELRWLGYAREEVVGTRYADLMTPASREVMRQNFPAFKDRGWVDGLEFELVRKDGSTFPVLLSATAVTDAGGRFVKSRSSIFDLTERKRLEETLRHAKEEAESASKAKSTFLANMSHEIRTPMNGILGLTELVLEGELDPQQRQHLGMVRASAEALLGIINDILDFSKIEAGKLTIEQIAFSPAALVQGAVALFQARALEKNLHLTLSLPEHPPAALLGDPTRIRQILLNLIDNAIKFTQQGKIVLRVSFEAEGDAIACRFMVEDSGIGLSADAQSRLFQAFSQADSSTTRRYGGTGLGLAVSSQLASLMGGQLTVESTPDQGSRFTLLLRLSPTELALVELPAPPALQLKGRILVVEDHPVNQKVLAHQLREMGLQHALAANGTEALERLANEAFDLVLMDWQMPEMDGLEATRRIRQLPTDVHHIPVIALTANANSVFRETCLAAGANDYLSKPYSDAALAAVLAQWLPQHRPAARAPLLDVAALHARYPGNPDLVNDLVKLFISTTEASLAALQRGIEQADAESCGKEAHALKGAAASVMASAIQESTARIEACVKNGDFAAAAVELAVLQQTFNARA